MSFGRPFGHKTKVLHRYFIEVTKIIMNTQHVLIIGSVWPEPNSSAAGSRMLQLIGLFQLQGWEITFACAAADSDYMVDLNALNIQKVNIELNNTSFDDFIKKLQPSIVLFDRFMVEEQFGWRVATYCNTALRILDTEDLHCLRAVRKQALKENKSFTVDDLMLSDIAKREIASILRSDLSLIISTYEMTLLKEHFKIDESLLFYIPFLLDRIEEDIIKKWKKFNDRKDFVSIGNFLHEPNLDAVHYLKQTIWPLISKNLPDAALYIYGAYPSQKVNELNQPKENFYVMGRAENAKEVIEKSKVVLAPLRFGAGIKGKLVEAMQCGTPSVTTSIGAEGMHAKLKWSGTIANQPDEIATAAIQLYTNQVLWEDAQQQGITIINDCYRKKTGEDLLIRIDSIQNIIHKHRSTNFIGAMLMHHSMASTKYMARWIEAKNKVNK